MRVDPILLGLCLFGSSFCAFGQHLSAGVVGGASLTEDFQNQQVGVFPLRAYSTPKRWIVGGTVEVGLPFHLAVELNGLYHELEYTSAAVTANGVLNSVSPAPVVTWEFPILAKYRFSFPLLKPFLEAGPSFRSSGNLNGTSPSNHGVAAGLGVEARLGKLRIAPRIRYLRWARDQHVNYYAPSTVPDQVEFLAGISF